MTKGRKGVAIFFIMYTPFTFAHELGVGEIHEVYSNIYGEMMIHGVNAPMTTQESFITLSQNQSYIIFIIALILLYLFQRYHIVGKIFDYIKKWK